MAKKKITLELLPEERAALLQWSSVPEVHSQLEALASSDDVESIIVDRVSFRWLASDVTHAIVKQGCRDELVFDLSERLDYVEETGDGSLESWY